MSKKIKTEYVSYEELYKAYIDCRKRKRSTVNAMEFEFDENYNLYKLYVELNNMTYKVGRSIVFCVDKPVKREVFAADFRDRIIHHLVINRLMKMFEDEFIYDSYSCRKGKGTYFAILQCAKYINEASEHYTNPTYVIKCDLKSFFMTIDKNLLYDKLIKHIKSKYTPKDENDIPFLEYILKLIVFNMPQENCIFKQPKSNWDDLPKEKSLFNCEENKGLPIGNLTSQIFANFFLSEFDHFVQDELGIKYYGRYVDDFYIIVNNKDIIQNILKKCKEKLASIGVKLHPKKLYIQEVRKGVKFVGAVIKPNRIYISNRTKGNMWESLREFGERIDYLNSIGEEPSLAEIERFASSMNSYLGFMRHYKTFNIRKKLLTSDDMKKWSKYCYFNENLTKISIFDEYKQIHGRKKTYSREEFIENNIDIIIKEKIHNKQ